MHNDLLEKKISDLYDKALVEETIKKFEGLATLFDDEEESRPLSEYSTTQLKAELRRRKRERRGVR